MTFIDKGYKLVRLDKKYWPPGGYGHWCPGCNSGHEINVDRPNASGAKWTFDGNMDCPTFSPSINLQINPPGNPHYQPDVKSARCHYFIRAGRIQFLPDCTHALAGQTVDLPDIPEGQYLSSRWLMVHGGESS
jgi:hypothetical protein